MSDTTAPKTAGDRPLPGAKTPVGIGQVAVVGVLWPLILIGIGVVAVRDALVHGDLLGGDPWSRQALEALDGRSAPGWLVLVAVVCLLLAGWLIYVALNPRPHKGAALQASSGVFLTTTSLRRLATAAAKDVDGVDTATANATLSRVSVVAVTTPDQIDAVKAGVHDAVTERLSALAKPPRVRVRIRTTGGQP